MSNKDYEKLYTVRVPSGKGRVTIRGPKTEPTKTDLDRNVEVLRGLAVSLRAAADYLEGQESSAYRDF